MSSKKINRNSRKFRKPKCRSKDHNEDDLITLLDEYFNDFVDNLRDNNFDKMNMMLVKNITSKFAMILHLWDENRIFRGSFEKEDMKQFRNIYKSMMNAFSGSNEKSVISQPIVDDFSNDFTVECNHCGETFPLRNNDVIYSFQMHATSEQHKEFVQNLLSQTSSSEDSDCDEVEIKTADDDVIVNAYEQLFIYARCNLCYTRITFGDMNIVEQEAVVSKCIMAHLKGSTHRHKIEVFRSNKHYVQEVHLPKNMFGCKLCGENLYLDDLIKHFESNQHKVKASKDDSDGETNDEPSDSEYRQRVPTLQPSSCVCKGVSSELAKLCIDHHKPKIIIDTIKPGNAVTPKSSAVHSVSVFNASCIIVKDGFVQCKLCTVKFIKENEFYLHMNGKKHLRNIKNYESYYKFVKIIGDEIHCSLCDDFMHQRYKKFFDHCRSDEAHCKNIKEMSIKFPKFIVQREASKVIPCPIEECSQSFSRFGSILKHLRSSHLK